MPDDEKIPNEQFAQGFDETRDPEDVLYGDYDNEL